MIKPIEAVSHSFLFATHDKFLRPSLQVKEYVARFYSVKITAFWNIALCSLIEEDWGDYMTVYLRKLSPSYSLQ
jgi:hypothetical protein